MPQTAGLLIRRLLVVVAMLLLGWLAVKVGITGIARSSNPELALWLSPRDSRALSNLADRILVEKQTSATLQRAAALSKAAIATDPTNVVAIRTIGLVRPPAAQLPYFIYSNRLSKRDLATQLWLIENQIAKGNARGALAHYDAALRTSETAPTLLFPILSAASEDRELAPEIAKALAKRPDWAQPFLYELVNSAPSPDTLALIFEHVKKAGTPLPVPLTDNLTRRMMRDYRYDLVLRAYFVAGGSDAQIGRSITNPAFTREPASLPLDWAFTSDEKIFSGRLEREDRPSDFRMIAQASDGVAGEAVRQLLFLKPGRFRLTAQAGNVPSPRDARVAWRLMCADRDETRIDEMVLPQSGPGGAANYMDFDVPTSRCSAQWLALRITSQTDGDGVDAWFDNVKISQRSRAIREQSDSKSLKGNSKS
jgi:hypothetical protein